MNLIDNDGCSNGVIDPGYSCSEDPPLCSRCGDGVLLKSVEMCDDGNLDDFDGCSQNCEVEDID